jgi:urate oxidase
MTMAHEESTRHAGPVEGLEYEITYGKRRVPVYRVYAQPLRGIAPVPESTFTGRDNVLLACEVDMQVFGDDFLPSYTVGDNSMVVATDSMKNIILKEALEYDGATLEGYLAHVGGRMIDRYEQVHDLELRVRELPFAPALVSRDDGRFDDSDVLFDHRGGSDASIATLRLRRDGAGSTVVDHECGRVGLRLLKVTGSAFTKFVRDEHTTLPDRGDRPLYVFMDVFWRYREVDDLLDPSHARYVPAEQVRDIVASVFHAFVSESIQHLVHEMGLRLLERFPQLAEVRFVAQNRTRDPFHASETDPAVKVYSDPFPAYGEITLRLRRKEEDA